MGRERNPDDSRTHARPPAEPLAIPALPSSVDERINFIADMMGLLQWERGKSVKVVAAIWGIPESTVRNYSTEASRLVVADADDARRDITAGCRRLFREAVEGGDAKGAKAVGDLWADISGAKAPEKHQIGALDETTPAKARAVMAELFRAPESKPDEPKSEG